MDTSVKQGSEGRWSAAKPAEPVAWTHFHQGGRVFYTTLGHWGDFEIPAFQKLLANAIAWALAREKG